MNNSVNTKEEKGLKEFYGEDGIYVRIQVIKDFKEREDDRKSLLEYAEYLGNKIAKDKATKSDYLNAAEILFILSCHPEIEWIRLLRNDFYLKVFKK